MFDGTPIGLCDSSPHVQSIRTPKGYPIQLKSGSRFLGGSHQVGGVSVEADHITVDPVLFIEVSVPIQIFRVVSAVGSGAVGLWVSKGKNPSRSALAILDPQPDFIQP
jgi:hypothetical protein